MTVDSAFFIEIYNADGEVNYPFKFESIGGDAIQVYSLPPTGARVLISDKKYAVELEGQGPIYKRGKIILKTPLDDGHRLFVRRSTPITNEQVFEAGKPFQPEALEFGIDKATMILQEIEGYFCDCGGVNTPPDGGGGAPCVAPIITSSPVDVEVSLGYTCDSYEQAIVKLAGSNYWPMNDLSVNDPFPGAPVSTTIAPGGDGQPLTAVGFGHTAQVVGLLLDDCTSGTGWRAWNGGGASSLDNGPSLGIYGFSFSALIFRGARTINLLRYGYDGLAIGPSNVSCTETVVSHRYETVGGDFPTFNVPGDYTGTFLLQVILTEDGMLVLRDGIKQGFAPVGTEPGEEVKPHVSGGTIDFIFTVSDCTFQHLTINGSNVTAGVLAQLAGAYIRNGAGYIRQPGLDIGDVAEFTATITGSFPMTLQWYTEADDLPVAGEVGGVLRVTITKDNLYTGYYIIATNDCGTVQSDPAFIFAKVS